MDCKEVCRRVPDYLEKNLTPEETEQFLNHVNSCSECYEELELYYTLNKGLRLLDSDEFQVGNMSKELRADLLEQAERVAAYYRMRVARYVCNTLAFLSVLTALAFQVRIWMDLGLF